MTTYAHRAAVADRILAEHNHPAVIAVTVWGDGERLTIQTRSLIPGIDYEVIEGSHYILEFIREDVPVTLSCFAPEEVSA